MTDLNAVYFSAAVVLAAALIVYRLARTPDAMDGKPAPGSDFSRFGGDIRLRDLYRLAVMLEEEGIALYLKLAQLAEQDATRKLCMKLADDEEEHRQLFRDRLDRWRTLHPNKVTWPLLLEQVKLEGLFDNPPGPKADEQAMAAFAIRQERRTVEFYRLFEAAFPDAWRRDKLQDLVEQEMSHEQKLREAYPGIV